MTPKKHNVFYCSKNNGMKLRSGTIINCIINNNEAINDMISISNFLNYSNSKCEKINKLFNFIEKYQIIIMNHYDWTNCYFILRKKIMEFVDVFNSEYIDIFNENHIKKNFCDCCNKCGKCIKYSNKYHDTYEIYANLQKWNKLFKKPHKNHAKIYKFLSYKLNYNISDYILLFL